ncbi:MAG: aldehyde dehydrogenase (NADP(+)) [Bacteroidota bacterium]
MNLTGKNYIAGITSASSDDTFKAVNPATRTDLAPNFHIATVGEVRQAVEEADKAFSIYAKKAPEERANFLETIADEILNLGDVLVTRAMEESGLPEGRIKGERGRTMNQLKLFAKVVRSGYWVDARIDRADPSRQPAPKPDVRSMLKPLGAVGVFGASNFPLAFSVAGGDTASALAAGCPVVVKGHPSHPGTCELIAQAINAAIQKCNMPKGTFSLIQGNNHESGMQIVQHPLIKAIGFTGSFRGGKAIFDAAQQRPEPIPVYAEMGSTNPVFILPNALKTNAQQIAEGLTKSVTLGVGQFCTNPGLVFGLASKEFMDFQAQTTTLFQAVEANTMLNGQIHTAFENGVAHLQEQKVSLLAKGKANEEGFKGTAHLFQTSSDAFLAQANLEEELFGPSTILIATKSKADLMKSAQQLHGHLTAAIFATEEDLENHHDLIEILERKVGRLMINTFPTGVEVCHAMVHGGPFPSTTASNSTSVGTRAITRFARPVCYQNFPQSLLPDELKDDNPLGIVRMVDGKVG